MMYYISDKGPIQDLLMTMEDPLEEFMFSGDDESIVGDWLQNMPRW